MAGAPRPKSIPLDVKVVIIGHPRWYYTFFTADPDFRNHFKIKADIDPDMEASEANVASYSGPHPATGPRCRRDLRHGGPSPACSAGPRGLPGTAPG